MKTNIELTQKEFELFQRIVFNEIGISLENNKLFLVKNRLLKRLIFHSLSSYSDYYRLIQINKNEKITMFNLITTNETYFFREQKHFDFLKDSLIPFSKKLRIWSAASSTGVEAYSLAMLLHDSNIDYEIFASDINTEVIKKANIGLYPLKMMDKIPEKLKLKYCLKGKGEYEGWFLVDRILLNNMKFENKNLLYEHKDLGSFDVIFLRNVLIYFNNEMKKKIIDNVMKNLKVGGYIIISLTEHIRELNNYKLKKVGVSIYQKVD